MKKNESGTHKSRRVENPIPSLLGSLLTVLSPIAEIAR